MSSILDTNIISELMKASPNSNLLDWVDSQEPNKLFITSITIAEISYGITVLPAGNRRFQLDQAFKTVLKEGFAERVLVFDEKAALVYGELMAYRKQIGKPLSIQDGQIAAIALLKKYSLVTRDKNDFLHCGLELVNPF